MYIHSILAHTAFKEPDHRKSPQHAGALQQGLALNAPDVTHVCSAQEDGAICNAVHQHCMSLCCYAREASALVDSSSSAVVPPHGAAPAWHSWMVAQRGWHSVSKAVSDSHPVAQCMRTDAPLRADAPQTPSMSLVCQM
eukprot:jgi/Ulvmu1/6503/UM003_0136.1